MPAIELRWKEVGLSFQLQFVKRDFIPTLIPTQEKNVGINSELLLLIRQNNHILAKELAGLLGISTRQCECIIADLKERGIIERKGSKKYGYWEIIE